MTQITSHQAFLKAPPYNYTAHHRKIFSHSAANTQLWTELTKGDQNRLFETRKEYDRCKDGMLIGEVRSSFLGRLATLVEKSAYLALFGYQAAQYSANSQDKNIFDVCALGLQVALTGLGMSPSLIGNLPYLPNSLPKIAGQVLSLIGVGARLSELHLNQKQSLKSRAEHSVRACQFAHQEHLRLSVAEIDTLHRFVKQANQDESDNHRALLEIFRNIRRSKK